VSDVFTAANIESLPSASIKSRCEAWTQAKAIESEESTHARYNRVIEQFTGFIGAKSNRDLAPLQASDIAVPRLRGVTTLARDCQPQRENVARLSGEAVRQGLLTVNPAARAKLLKSSQTNKPATCWLERATCSRSLSLNALPHNTLRVAEFWGTRASSPLWPA